MWRAAWGLPIERLIIATNGNDILAARARRPASTSRAPVDADHAPAMDIQVSSNFERLFSRPTTATPTRSAALMRTSRQAGAFDAVGARPGAYARRVRRRPRRRGRIAATIRAL